jgi:DNA-binding XRE family transcriptional regulator
LKGLTQKDFALGVQLVRRRHDLTLRDLGEKCHVHHTTIGNLEGGEDCLLSTAISVSTALGTSIEELMKWGAAAERGGDAPD